MAVYAARTISISTLIIQGNHGFAKPLCNQCQARDCENPIESREVIVAGVPQKMRVWVTGIRYAYVMQCEGFCE